MSRFKTILVPVDFSDHSVAALDVAIEFAKLFDSKIHLLHCYQIQPGGISPYGITVPSGYFAEIRDAATKKLDEWQKKHVPKEISVQASTMSEVPSEAIVQAAEKLGADLIVMGTRGLSGIKHVLLGSVTERTVRHAPCPVLTVRGDD